ncbi:MAG: FliM/FliN family flagellar motor switch protein [Aeromonas sp.]
MLAGSVSLTQSRLISADQGEDYPQYDLLGVERANQVLFKQWNALLGPFALQTTAAAAQLFNSANCELEFTDFFEAKMAILPEETVWVEATDPANPQHTVYFSIASHIVYRLTVFFFAGTLLPADEAVQPTNKTLSVAEERLLLRLCQLQIERWRPEAIAVVQDPATAPAPTEWKLALITREMLPEEVFLASDVVLTAGVFVCPWRMWLPKPNAGVELEGVHFPRDQLERAMTQLPVQLRIVMGQLPMTLADLTNLHVGDVLALEMPELAPALIGNRLCFHGHVAENKGSLVYQIAKVVEE